MELISLSSGAIPPADTTEDYLGAYDIVEKCYYQFKQERLINSETETVNSNIAQFLFMQKILMFISFALPIHNKLQYKCIKSAKHKQDIYRHNKGSLYSS